MTSVVVVPMANCLHLYILVPFLGVSPPPATWHGHRTRLVLRLLDHEPLVRAAGAAGAGGGAVHVDGSFQVSRGW